MSSISELDSIVLDRGNHRVPTDGMCVMEANAYVNDLPFSGRPACVCPALGAFLRNWNDSAGQDERQLLKQYIARIGNTNDGKTNGRARLLMDWIFRDRLPLFLEALHDPKAKDCAAGLRGLNQKAGRAELELAIPFINASRALALDRALDLDRGLDLALDLDRALDLDLALALARALELALNLALALARGLDIDLDRALALARGLDLAPSSSAAAELRCARVDLMERMLAL